MENFINKAGGGSEIVIFANSFSAPWKSFQPQILHYRILIHFWPHFHQGDFHLMQPAQEQVFPTYFLSWRKPSPRALYIVSNCFRMETCSVKRKIENQLKSFTLHSWCGYVINAAFTSLTNCLWLHKKLVSDNFCGKEMGAKGFKIFLRRSDILFHVMTPGPFGNFPYEQRTNY